MSKSLKRPSKASLIVTLSVFALIISFFTYRLFFYEPPIEIIEHEEGPYHLVYTTVKGSYLQTPEKFAPILQFLKDLKIEALHPYAIYYHNTEKVPESDLLSESGYIISEQDFKKFEIANNEYETRFFPKRKVISIKIPFFRQTSAKMATKLSQAIRDYQISNNLMKAAIYRKYSNRDGWVMFLSPVYAEKNQQEKIVE